MPDTLKRQLGLGLLTAYGVGIMVGAAGDSSYVEIGLHLHWLALTLPVASLAEITTMALLVVFAIVNAALIGLKRRKGTSPFEVPVIVPWFGLFACIGAFAAGVGGIL